MECSNHLKQIGLAIHGYLDANKVFPVSSDNYGPQQSGWIPRTLAFMEEQPLYDQFASSISTSAIRCACRPFKRSCPRCAAPKTSRAASFLPPSCNGKALPLHHELQGGRRRSEHRRRLARRLRQIRLVSERRDVYICTYQQPVRARMVPDGFSQTFMVGEDVPEQNVHSMWSYANGDYASCNPPLNYFPNPPIPASWWLVISFRSKHPAGANFCFVDGSVHFISEEVDFGTYQALATRVASCSARTNRRSVQGPPY